MILLETAKKKEKIIMIAYTEESDGDRTRFESSLRDYYMSHIGLKCS